MDTEDQKRRVLVNLHHGRKEEALIKAIIPTTGGKKFQLDFGIDQTALVEDWQIMEQPVGTRTVSELKLSCGNCKAIRTFIGDPSKESLKCGVCGWRYPAPPPPPPSSPPIFSKRAPAKEPEEGYGFGFFLILVYIVGGLGMLLVLIAVVKFMWEHS